MKIKLILTVVLFTILTQSSIAQTLFSWEDFAKKARPYYSILNRSEIQNFSSLITSATYINYLKKNNYDSTYTYPLKFIWTNQGKVYYILQPHPNMNDTTKRKDDLLEIQALKNQFKGFLIDWQNFSLFSPFEDIPENPVIKAADDTVQISYINGEGQFKATVKKLFLVSGKLVKVTVISSGQKIITSPVYQESEGKWLCTGWDSQIFESGKVTSGTATRLELSPVQNYWMPYRAAMLIQTIEKPEEKYLLTIYMKDYIFNLALQEIKKPKSSKLEVNSTKK